MDFTNKDTLISGAIERTLFDGIKAEEKILKLEEITGIKIDKIIELFATGNMKWVGDENEFFRIIGKSL